MKESVEKIKTLLCKGCPLLFALSFEEGYVFEITHPRAGCSLLLALPKTDGKRNGKSQPDKRLMERNNQSV